jgi:hypothetical protein
MFDPRDRFFFRSDGLGRRDVLHEICLGFKPAEEDVGPERQFAEMVIAWEKLGGGIAARFNVFDENWAALAAMPELISLLGELGANMTPAKHGFASRVPPTIEQVSERLIALGFRDDTMQPRDLPADTVVELLADVLDRRSEVKDVAPTPTGLTIGLQNGRRLNVAVTTEG